MASNEPHSFWDSVRSWADSAGLLLPPDPESAEDPPRAKVPQAVCDSCPICQAAATLDQVNPQVVADLTEVARSVLSGLSSALGSAADQRHGNVAVERVRAGGAEDVSEQADRDAPRQVPDAEAPDPDHRGTGTRGRGMSGTADAE